MKDLKEFVTHLRFEAITLGVLMVVLTYTNNYSLWWIPGLFLIFDIGMVGYLVNSKIGAMTYNLTHNLTTPTLMIAAGVYWGVDWVLLGGFVWTFHIALDRTLGFGLKHKHSFHDTHMGVIKKK